MIDRYSVPIVSQIWNDEFRYQMMINYSLKYIEFFLKKEINLYIKADVEKIKALESTTKHETVAVLKYIDSQLETHEHKKYLHYGLTSSDILDTVSSIQIFHSIEIIILFIEQLFEAKYYWPGSISGRTHGQYAEEIPIQLRLKLFYEELRTCKKDLINAQSNLMGKAHGPTGQWAWQGQKKFIQSFKLKTPKCVTQIIPRHHYIDFMVALTKTASCIERFATNVRLMSISGLDEISETRTVEQCGSSAMPHKNNPILSENLCGLARLVRNNLDLSFENVNLWHERDMTHSSVERVIWPDSFNLTAFMLTRTKKILDSLYINDKLNQIVVEANKDKLNSHNDLLKLIQSKDLTRMQAYEKELSKFR
jgi:adenylosuccinate lyase